MKTHIIPFKYIILLCFYLAIENLILLLLTWWLSHSNSAFWEILYFARKPILRLFILETIVFSFSSVFLYLTYIRTVPPIPPSLNEIVNLFQKEEEENLSEDINFLNKTTGIIVFGGVLIFLMGYFLEGIAWQIALLRPILWILPLTIASLFAFFLQIPIGFLIFRLGDFINKHYFNPKL